MELRDYLRALKLNRIFLKARKNHIEDVKKEYIKGNAEYEEGEKVDIYRWGKKRGEGIITGNEVDSKDDTVINPIVNRVDENGKVKNTRWWKFWNYDELRRK